MKAITIPQPGPPEVLTLAEVPEPMPGRGEILIEIAATALNRADLMQRAGHYPPPAGASPYPGLECAGRVAACGPEVDRFTVGARVMALLAGGGYAERVAVAQETVMPLPDGLDWAQGAAIPEAWLTAYSNLIEIGGLQAGEVALIHAGASGVGSAAIQLGRRRGATVFATASRSKLARVRELGAAIAVDYAAENFADRVLEATDGRGVNVIVDFIGAPYWKDNLRALARWGRLVLVGLMGGREVRANLGLFLAKKLSVHGSTLRDRTLAEKGRLVRAFAQDVLPDFDSGALQPVLDARRFPLAEAAAAHTYMAQNRNIGKIILEVAAL